MSDRRPQPFIDSNIWLYALIDGPDAAKGQAARELISGTEPVVSVQIVQEVCANLLRKGKFREAEILETISAFYGSCTVLELSEGTLRAASDLRERYRLSYWDSTVVASALESGVSTLWSEDMHDGQVVEGRLRIVNPFLAS